MRLLTAGLAATAAVACGGGNLAQQILKPPKYKPRGQTQCHAVSSTTEPLIVEWPSAARGELEDIVENKKAIAVVRYEGCQMKVLATCTAPGRLGYTPLRNTKQDEVRIRNADELYSTLPVGAASLEGKLQTAGELDVDVTLVGRFETDVTSFTSDQLQGDCAGATHFVRAVTVGAFDFHTGASADVSGGVHVLGAGGGGSSTAQQENIARDGKMDACAGAKGEDTDPPDNCGALVRLEVLPIRPAVRAVSASTGGQPSASDTGSAATTATPREIDGAPGSTAPPSTPSTAGSNGGGMVGVPGGKIQICNTFQNGGCFDPG
jgi:hypothetical protein